MAGSRIYGLSGSIFGLVGIVESARGDLLAAAFMAAAAIACALRAHAEWKREKV